VPSANTSLLFEDRIDIFDDDHRKNFVIPAQAGIQKSLNDNMDSCFRRNDPKGNTV